MGGPGPPSIHFEAGSFKIMFSALDFYIFFFVWDQGTPVHDMGLIWGPYKENNIHKCPGTLLKCPPPPLQTGDHHFPPFSVFFRPIKPAPNCLETPLKQSTQIRKLTKWWLTISAVNTRQDNSIFFTTNCTFTVASKYGRLGRLRINTGTIKNRN